VILGTFSNMKGKSKKSAGSGTEGKRQQTELEQQHQEIVGGFELPEPPPRRPPERFVEIRTFTTYSAYEQPISEE
jgi:hypothetical protein